MSKKHDRHHAGQPEQPPANTAVENADSAAEPADLTAQMAKLEAELQEAKDKYLYLQADYQNYRRRAVKDANEARIIGTTSALEPFLTVNDYLQMARLAAEQSDNVAALKQGLMMIIGEYDKAMDELGVVRFKSLGEQFNPACHEAIDSEERTDVPENQIVRELSGGYKMGERLLRPARVIVAVAPAQEATPAVEPDESAVDIAAAGKEA